MTPEPLRAADGREDLGFETTSPARRMVNRLLICPLANWMPAGLWRGLLRFGRSELAAANWADPGGWRSMVISYDGRCTQIADKLLVGGGTMPKALRNRKRLAGALLAELIERVYAGREGDEPVHVLGLGAGPGRILVEAMTAVEAPVEATLVDLSDEAFDYGRKLYADRGLSDRVRFVQADIRHLEGYLDRPPDLLKMLGICEYLTDEQFVEVASAAAELMSPGAAAVVNSLSDAHGTDRFFRRVFGLNMIYREPEAICELMGRAGFGDFQVRAEPLGVYHVVVGHRTA
jgi:SAM-dependent methyltransferase